MLTKRNLRLLVIADLLLVVLGVVVGLLSEDSLPEPLRVFVRAQREADRDADLTTNEWIGVAIGFPLIIAMLVSHVGLFLFWRPARVLYVASLIGLIALSLFLGPHVSTGWVQAIDTASLTITGMVLALIYWSPLKELYEKPKETA